MGCFTFRSHCIMDLCRPKKIHNSEKSKVKIFLGLHLTLGMRLLTVFRRTHSWDGITDSRGGSGCRLVYLCTSWCGGRLAKWAIGWDIYWGSGCAWLIRCRCSWLMCIHASRLVSFNHHGWLRCWLVSFHDSRRQCGW